MAEIRGRGPAPQSVNLAPATINLTASVTATGTLTLTVNRAAPLTERVERLEQCIASLKGRRLPRSAARSLQWSKTRCSRLAH